MSATVLAAADISIIGVKAAVGTRAIIPALALSRTIAHAAPTPGTIRPGVQNRLASRILRKAGCASGARIENARPPGASFPEGRNDPGDPLLRELIKYRSRKFSGFAIELE
jgi:hypothetical protein